MTTMTSMIKDARDRWKSETPPFFKKIARYSKYIAWGSGIVAAGLTSVMTAGVAIPFWVPIIIGAVTAMSTAASATAGLATTDKEILERDSNK